MPHPVIGVDEVGRGCLAGPVFSAAVVLKNEETLYSDSKTVSPEKRIKLAKHIMLHHIYGLGMASVEEIENTNILEATFLSMRRAILQLPFSKGHVIVDGHLTIPHLPDQFHQTACIKGDSWASPIAASSLVAKVKRDEWISKQDEKYSEYGFSVHKGYATRQHKKAIIQHGPCPLHRKTFSGVKEYLK